MDEMCAAKGIPAHLHQLERLADQVFEAPELLYRRYKLAAPDLTSAISFSRMSVNREKYSEGPEDVLWDDQQGGRHEGYGVVQFSVGDLAASWAHPDGKVEYHFGVAHLPEQCNYPHTEVAAAEVNLETKTRKELDGIKPSSVKLRIREHLQTRVSIVIPAEDAGRRLPV